MTGNQPNVSASVILAAARAEWAALVASATMATTVEVHIITRDTIRDKWELFSSSSSSKITTNKDITSSGVCRQLCYHEI